MLNGFPEANIVAGFPPINMGFPPIGLRIWAANCWVRIGDDEDVIVKAESDFIAVDAAEVLDITTIPDGFDDP